MTRFGFVSTYPPTRCGLATFTASLATAIAGGADEAVIVRVDDLVPAGAAIAGAGVEIGDVLHPGDAESRSRAAETLNACDVVVIQHEYGIYGGRDGDEVLDLLAQVHRPVIVVMHTVLAAPTPHQQVVTAGIIDRADTVVAMTSAAARTLGMTYAFAAGRLRVIPHGVDEWTARTARHPHSQPVILTWGLIGPGKGIEWGIRAIAELTGMTPAPQYRVLGETHPKVVRDSGQHYRRSLWALADELGVSGQIDIDGRYREPDELAAEVSAADMILLPYDSRDQATSGVLAEAVAAGKPVIATRFPHAVELLADGGGVLVGHESPDDIAAAVRTVWAAPPASFEEIVHPARTIDSRWTSVAERYRELAAELAGVLGGVR